MERRLAAVLFADLVGFTRLMEQNEVGTLEGLRALRSHCLDPTFRDKGGRVVKLVGDGVIVEFASSLAAVECALAIQRQLAEGVGAAKGMQLRIGLHLCDVLIDGDDIYGEGVNLAARLESACPPGGVCLSQSIVDQVRGRVSVEFKELPAAKFKNVSQPVRAYTVAGLGEKPVVDDAIAESDRGVPSVAVLNFAAKDASGESQLLAQGIAEDLITSLSKFRELFVVSYGSSRRFDPAKEDHQEIARKLGVRYLVEGGVRRAGETLRLNLHVIDTRSGMNLWSESFDRKSEDLFEVQDEIVELVVRTLVRKISSAEIERLRRSRPETYKEYELVLQARSIVADTPEKNEESRQLYLAAIEANRNYAEAWSGLSGTYLMDRTSAWASDPEDSLAKALEAARKAVQIDPADSHAQRRVGHAALMGGDVSSAEYHFKRAVELNPNAASGWIYLGLLEIYRGNAAKALEHVEKAMRHNPFHETFYFWFQGLALYGARRYEEALAPLKRAVAARGGFIAPHRHLAACYAMLGQQALAEKERDAILKMDPGFTIKKLLGTLAYEDKEAQEHYLDGLRRAGLPEE
jgi:adenylate cyclase